MGGWGQTKDRGAGSTGAVEEAHEALDARRVPGGSLAARVLALLAQDEHDARAHGA